MTDKEEDFEGSTKEESWDAVDESAAVLNADVEDADAGLAEFDYGPAQAKRGQQEVNELSNEITALNAQAAAVEVRLEEQGNKVKKIRQDLELVRKNPDTFFGRKIKQQMDFSSSYIWTSGAVLTDIGTAILEAISMGFLGFITSIPKVVFIFSMQRTFKQKGSTDYNVSNMKVITKRAKGLAPLIPFMLTRMFISTRKKHNKEAEPDEIMVEKVTKDLEKKWEIELGHYRSIAKELNEIQLNILSLEEEINTHETRREINDDLAVSREEYEQTRTDYEAESSRRPEISGSVLKKVDSYEGAAFALREKLERKNDFESRVNERKKTS